MKKILILGASILQVPLIKRAKSLGYFVIVLDINPDAPGASIADKYYQISTNDLEKVYEISNVNKITGILTTSDFPVRVVAEVAKRLNLNALEPKVAEICTNKSLQRELLQNENFLCPKFKLIKNKFEINEIKNWIFPLIIKPVDSSASRGVQKVLSYAELEEAYDIAFRNSNCGEVIIEEFIEGQEFSVEVLIQDNKTDIIAITEKFTNGENGCFFVEEIHILPARISIDFETEVKNVVSRFIRALKLNNSAAHIEIKVNSRGIFIIEAAARLGGDFITTNLVPLATGVDMLKDIISISVGEKISIEKTKNNYAGIHFLTPENYERGKKHLEFISKKEGLVEYSIEEKKQSAKLRSSMDRLGYFIVNTATKEELEELIRF